MKTDAPYPAEYLEFVRLFNAREFHAAHDALEALWQVNRCAYHQGLIQVAVGLYHLGNGNIAGARKLLAKARKKLIPSVPDQQGLDVADLVEWIASVLPRLPAARRIPPCEVPALGIAIPTLRLETAVSGE